MDSQAAWHGEGLRSLREVGVSKLRAVGRALELPEAMVRSAVNVFDLMSAPWSALSAGDRPPWPNDITDDGTPFEFSVALDGRGCELRMLMESQSLPITATSSWDAGLSLQGRLRDAGLVSLARFQQVQDLFCPAPESETRFSLWHAAVLTDAARPLFKCYLNPAIQGKATAPHVVHEALSRLGLERASDLLAERLNRVATSDLRYVALDLDDAESARVKVYVGASESADEVEALLRGTANFAPGQATEWLSALARRAGPFPERPILCCFAFTTARAQPTATLHVPIRCYVDNDEQAARRIASLLLPDAAKRLRRILAAAADRPLGVGRGLLTYASLRPAPDRLRVTVYLAPEMYAIAAPRRVTTAVEHISFHDENGATSPVIKHLSDVRREIRSRLALLAIFLRDVLRVSRTLFDDAILTDSVIEEEFERVVSQLHTDEAPPARLEHSPDEPGADAELAVPTELSGGALEAIERVTAAMLRLAADLQILLQSSPLMDRSASEKPLSAGTSESGASPSPTPST